MCTISQSWKAILTALYRGSGLPPCIGTPPYRGTPTVYGATYALAAGCDRKRNKKHVPAKLSLVDGAPHQGSPPSTVGIPLLSFGSDRCMTPIRYSFMGNAMRRSSKSLAFRAPTIIAGNDVCNPRRRCTHLLLSLL